MRCDKCKKKCNDNWMPTDDWPKYTINEITGVFGCTESINLCDECSLRLKKWLAEEPDDNNKK